MTYQPVNAFDAFAIRVDSLEPPLVMTQPMGARFADHRGLIEMPALMVLFDDLGGIPFSFADRSSSSLQARLSVSVGPRPGLTDVLRGESVLSMSDEAFGSTTVRVTRGDDEEVAGGRARSARVGRARIGESEIVVGPTLPAPDDAELPEPIDQSLTGAQIVASIADGERRIGPLGELLGASIADADPAAVRLAIPAAKWMGNFFGTMHGGMIATIVAQAASLGVAANLRAGVGYQLVEFTVAFLRSPAVDGRSVTATAIPVKIGRRLSTVDVELHDADGILLARATADARCDV
ncbi:MAG TPA: PaaI family thioesterase [Gordonia sp. (in: high G+C Gram-positive bacteria)]|uniref:PaaI family thioesterase n=1 Tax=unclassified Gordonia (in: high G+C Gram-positive bacteria) TaxID=2657482 RepID=UPI000F94C806|nr:MULTISPECIES: PaaI family thioesterase [unclassified Gordonia (in: high G+C Gram-positive bacteria)]RUP40085.1 MAG: PaaI family thioesterase [Gordonia sp. (in: high G+C Gram-positive bacteria)]HNP57203.1 PaaI family thioesterase [Gordonia sp. (in: high G+C Gram-positive bacteria)]HRC50169.1 PaaI family thioesterase [Gordonia sp. (in: high G+C Gram-positive bacteria)]